MNYHWTKGCVSCQPGSLPLTLFPKSILTEKLNKVLDYVHFHFSEVIRLADVAKMVNMSEAHSVVLSNSILPKVLSISLLISAWGPLHVLWLILPCQ